VSQLDYTATWLTEGVCCSSLAASCAPLVPKHYAPASCTLPLPNPPPPPKECAEDVVQGALEGYNGTILCYGQTGEPHARRLFTV
jgi:hypothetical protein